MKDLFSVEGKVALVTGGSRGIGLMIARGFVEAGAQVYISARKADACEAAAAELSKRGHLHRAAGRPLEPRPRRGASPHEIAAREPALHILVNNAGANWGAPLAEYPGRGLGQGAGAQREGGLPPDAGAAAAAREGRARAADPARVINIGSIDGLAGARARDLRLLGEQGRRAPPDARARASKLAPRKITVNAVAPGPFESKMMAETLERLRRRDRRELPAQADRRARGHGRRRDLPRLARGRLRDRRRDPRRRRDLDHALARRQA